MRADVRRKLSMAARALDFAQAHPSTDASFVSLVSALTDRLGRASVLAVQEQDGMAGERTAIARRRALRREIEAQLKHLYRVAHRAGGDDPDLGRKILKVDNGVPNRELVTTAQFQHDLAVANQAQFVVLGLGETFCEELQQLITQFAQMTLEAHSGRSDHVSGGADLRALASECLELTSLLDGLNQARFRKEPGLRQAWESASNVVGPFRKAMEAGALTGTQALSDGAAAQPASAPVNPAV